MPIISTFCKKGGVGKTTFMGYLAHYYALKGKQVLVISADDQNSIFKLFGCDNFVTDRDDDFFENLFVGEKKPEEVVFEARPGLFLMKTMNTDAFSINLTLRRPEERKLRNLINSFKDYFDYIFIDFPPSSSRLSEILLDISENILLVVGLDALGLQGFSNTIQYFVDVDIDLSKINYVIPVGYHPIKLAPNMCLKELQKMAKQAIPNAQISVPVKDKSEIKNLQSEGVSVFDEAKRKDRFHEKNKNEVKKDLIQVYESIKI